MFRDRLEDRDHGGHTAAVYQHVESLDRLASAGGDSQADGAARGKLLEGRYSEHFDTNCRRHSRLVIRNFDSDVPGELDPVGVEGDDPDIGKAQPFGRPDERANPGASILGVWRDHIGDFGIVNE